MKQYDVHIFVWRARHTMCKCFLLLFFFFFFFYSYRKETKKHQQSVLKTKRVMNKLTTSVVGTFALCNVGVFSL